MFEFVARPSEGSDGKVGAQGTVLAGGSYGGLVGALGGGKHVRGVGWSAGLERLSLLLEEVAAERCAAVEAPPPHVALLPLEGGDEGTGGVGLRLRLAQRLRSGGVAAIGYWGGAALQKRLGKGTHPRAPACKALPQSADCAVLWVAAASAGASHAVFLPAAQPDTPVDGLSFAVPTHPFPVVLILVTETQRVCR